MKLVFRLVSTLFAALTVHFFMNMLSVTAFSLGPQTESLWIYGVISLIPTVLAGWFVWTRTAGMQHGLISSVFLGAFLLGGLGFVAGFAGPILLTPNSPQGPFLGIFLTGPAGFVLGGIGGLSHWLIRSRNTRQERLAANDNDDRAV